MTSCSLFASGLVSEYNSAVPTFSYRKNDHQNDYFGVQMTYLRGTSTCYQGGPQFTPVIRNDAAKFSVECAFKTSGTTYTGIFCPDASVTDIPNGVLTISYINAARTLPTPIPFAATFGPSPAPQIITATANSLASSTSTFTATAAPGFASTATVYSASATQTQTSTVYVTQTQITTNTNYVSSCLASPSSTTAATSTSASSTASSSSTTAATSTTTTSIGPVATSPISCPGSNGQTINTSAGTFVVECGADRVNGDMSNSPVYPSSYEGCIAACAGRDGCLDVSYAPNGACYLKNAIGNIKQDASIIGGRLIGARPSSSVSSSTSVASSTTGTPSAARTVTVTTSISGTAYQCTCAPASGLGATLDCPTSNGKTYTSDCGATYAIECYTDRFGDDIPGGASSANTLNECIAACDKTQGCVNVSWVVGSPGTCYKKSAIADIRRNDNIFGARQLTGCTASGNIKLHRKRVVRASTESEKNLQKRSGFYGPDYTYTQESSTVTKTAVSTSVYYTTVTVTPANSGTITKTVYTTTTKTNTITNSATVTQTQQTTVTTCPAVTKRAVL